MDQIQKKGFPLIGVIFLALGVFKLLQGNDWVVWIIIGVLFGGHQLLAQSIRYRGRAAGQVPAEHVATGHVATGCVDAEYYSPVEVPYEEKPKEELLKIITMMREDGEWYRKEIARLNDERRKDIAVAEMAVHATYAAKAVQSASGMKP
jgi:hypothetical protein